MSLFIKVVRSDLGHLFLTNGGHIVGAAAGGVGDRKPTVEADASRMAKLVAKQLEAFMANQRWA